MIAAGQPPGVYSARDRVDNEEWLARMGRAADRLDLDARARSCAEDLFLSSVGDVEADRSKRALLGASVYAGALVAGERRSQREVADAVGVSRLTVQGRWKDLLDEAGLEPPGW
jgi:transcription initiation factor TFIIIB Brf1 subunit/transcription initiation factor TFIIB